MRGGSKVCYLGNCGLGVKKGFWWKKFFIMRIIRSIRR